MSRNDYDTTSWATIIFFIILFCPVGIFLMVRKFYRKAKYTCNGKPLCSFGIIFLLLSAYFFSYFIDEATFEHVIQIWSFSLAYFLITGLPAIICIISGRKANKKFKRIQIYKELVQYQNQTSIQYLASASLATIDTTMKDLHWMIELNHFKDAYIDYENGEIILSNNINRNKDINMFVNNFGNVDIDNLMNSVKESFDQFNFDQMSFNQMNFNQGNSEKVNTEKVVVCNGCGGKNKVIRGKVNECEFCGSLLENTK